MPDEKDVTEESSSPLADAIASSPEALAEPQGTETGTPKEPVSQEQEEPRVPYSRLKEVVDEKNWLKQQLETQLQRQQVPIQQPQQPTQNPYAQMSPDEERFWREVDQRAERIAEQKVRQVSPVIDAGRMELAQMKVQQFRAAHSDVKPNSPEETAIAERISAGYLPEDAYRSVMWDNRFAQAEKQNTQQVKQKIEAKKQANVENRSNSSNSTAHTANKMTLRQRIEDNWNKMERNEL